MMVYMNRLCSDKSNIDWSILENILRSHYGVTSFDVSDKGGVFEVCVEGCGSRFVGIAMIGVYGGIIGEDDIDVIEDIDDGVSRGCVLRVVV